MGSEEAAMIKALQPKHQGLDERYSHSLHGYWTRAADPKTVRGLIVSLPVPGAIALRTRYHAISDSHQPTASAQFYLPTDVWDLQIALASRIDRAVISFDHVMATAAATDLLASHQAGLHALPVVEARVGLGDVARQRDQWEEAAGHYEAALDAAEAQGYRFGQIRALVPMGYLILQGGTVSEAAEIFQRVVRMARELDERLYLANALTGLGEARGRLDMSEAQDHLREATALFRGLKSPIGTANAMQHLGEIHRRARNATPAVACFEEARTAARTAGALITEVNALDGLGEMYLLQDDVTRAVDSYSAAFELASAEGYERGEAHATNGLGRCCAHLAEWKEAAELHRAAKAKYLALNDPLSATTALSGLAGAAERLSDPSAANAARAEAIQLVEQVRASQKKSPYQDEFADRFAGIYLAALTTAVRTHDQHAFVGAFEGLAGRRLAGLLRGGDDQARSEVEDVQLTGQMAARADHLPFGGTDLGDLSPTDRRTQLIGRLALRAGLPRVLEAKFESLSARLYTLC